MDYQAVLAFLSASFGKELVDYIVKFMPKQAVCSVSPLGNLYVVFLGQTDRTILIDAHMDEVHLLVTGVDEDGFVHVDRCGGVDTRILPGCAVTLWGQKPLYGIFCNMPPHLKNGNQDEVLPCNQMGIDIGLTKEQADLLVQPGDTVTFRHQITTLQQGRIAAKSMDNRAGIAALLRLSQLLTMDRLPPVTVVLQFSVLEETSGRFAGAVTGGFYHQPTEALVVDASFDQYPASSYATPGALGKGAMIGFSPILSNRISNRLRQIAQEQQLPFTEEVLGGRTGTNADGLCSVAAGIPTGLISYPIRNMHTPVEVVDPVDLETVAQLLFAYVMEGGVTQ